MKKVRAVDNMSALDILHDQVCELIDEYNEVASKMRNYGQN